MIPMINAGDDQKNLKYMTRKEDDEAMHEAIYQFIHVHYTEILAVFPMVMLLIGLWIAVGIDQYILKQKNESC